MSDKGPVDRAVAAVAASQRTIVTREQLIACGVGAHAISHRLRSGRLTAVFRGIYSVGCGVLPPLAQEQAALLAFGDGAFLSHQTSAFLWGLRSTRPDAIDVSVPPGHSTRRERLNVHRIRAVDPRELRRRDGLLLSSPARALLEIAGEVSAGELERALDDGLVHRLVRMSEVRAVLAGNPRRRGSVALAVLASERRTTKMTRSEAERLFLALVGKAGLPTPEVNVRIGRHEVDFLWREQGLIVETDGYETHRGRRAFERDRARDTELEAAGWRVIRFTWRQLLYQPELVVFRLGQMMAPSPRARGA